MPVRDTTCAGCLDLHRCQVGSSARITCVEQTQGNAAAVRRLAELGVRRGASIVAGRRTPGGGRIIGVDDAWLALDPATLRSLHVEVAPTSVPA
ncbi:ferrous iron transport protein A, partial [Tessaracoccus sp. SD287]|nr:ferrous iron transport protein A [Tessaracoccus sp. SD287]